jgi:hypothetical protein
MTIAPPSSAWNAQAANFSADGAAAMPRLLRREQGRIPKAQDKPVQSSGVFRPGHRAPKRAQGHFSRCRKDTRFSMLIRSPKRILIQQIPEGA